MTGSRPILPQEYRLSDLRAELDVHSIPDDTRSLHTLFAVIVNDIDRRADIHQSIKPEILEGIAQAWLYIAEMEDGVEVEVDQHRSGLSTEIDDPEDERPASSKSTAVGESMFDERLRGRPDHDVSLAEFERDMRRLDDLRRKYGHPGLNSAESSEVQELREEYELEHRKWWQRQYLAEKKETADSTNVSPSSASVSQ